MRALAEDTSAPFHSPYAHGFVRVSAAVPHVRTGDPRFNGRRTIELARRAHNDHAALVIFPELGWPVTPARTCFTSRRCSTQSARSYANS